MHSRRAELSRAAHVGIARLVEAQKPRGGLRQPDPPARPDPPGRLQRSRQPQPAAREQLQAIVAPVEPQSLRQPPGPPAKIAQDRRPPPGFHQRDARQGLERTDQNAGSGPLGLSREIEAKRRTIYLI